MLKYSTFVVWIISFTQKRHKLLGFFIWVPNLQVEMAKRNSVGSMKSGTNNRNFVANYGTAHDDDEGVSGNDFHLLK